MTNAKLINIVIQDELQKGQEMTKIIEVKEYRFQQVLSTYLPNLSYQRLEAVQVSYQDPRRKYYNLGYVENILREAERLPYAEWDWGDNEVIALFLMLIYQKIDWQDEYESRSADWAIQDILDGGGEETLAMIVKQGVESAPEHDLEMAGKSHQRVVKVLLDLNFLVLASDPKTFWEYNRLLEQELANINSPESIRLVRKHMAWEILQRPRIFFTEHFSVLEPRARENLLHLIYAPS